MPIDDFPTVTPVTLRQRAVGNLLQMGHCAPAVMQTMLDASDTDASWLVLLTAGLPGGIGNTGGECGGVTAPLVLLGLRHPRDETRDGLPVVVDQGHDLMSRFDRDQGTTQCREIRGRARVPLRCIAVVRAAPQQCSDCLHTGDLDAIPPEVRAAYATLYAHWTATEFHCADEVLTKLPALPDVPPGQLRDAVTAFMGGTLFTGGTCSAFTGGVMALGLAQGEIEHSRPRVLRMIATMAVGGDAFADDMNAFNHTMNLGHELARWFKERFGSTQCRALTGCDFATARGVEDYLAADGTTTCKELGRAVAARVAEMIASVAAEAPVAAESTT